MKFYCVIFFLSNFLFPHFWIVCIFFSTEKFFYVGRRCRFDRWRKKMMKENQTTEMKIVAQNVVVFISERDKR